MIKNRDSNSRGPVIRAGGGNRTRMEQAPLDFESSASTYFTTPAKPIQYKKICPNVKNKVWGIPLTFLDEFSILDRSVIKLRQRPQKVEFLPSVCFTGV